MPKITKEDLQNYKNLLQKEKDLLNKFLESNSGISRVYYNEDMVIIQFLSHCSIGSDYLDNLKELIDYKSYTVEVATVTNEFFKIKYDENILQLKIFL